MASWNETHAELTRLAERQLFFIGGAPRSGTTWLQQMLDSHPDVSCRGEGLFDRTFAAPLDRMMAERNHLIEAKNTAFFRHSGGYPLPLAADAGILLGTAVLLALRQQSAGQDCQAIGEKTPENVFLFPRLKQLFPDAKLICIARDPRDALTSSWHFFHKPVPGEDENEAKTAFLRASMPPIAQGARNMLALVERYPADCVIVTYEALHQDPAPVMARLFRMLGVSDRDALVQDCLKQTSFAAMTGGRAAGVAQNGSFLRKGVVGDWTSTLTHEMNDMLLQELGWMFPHFGWIA